MTSPHRPCECKIEAILPILKCEKCNYDLIISEARAKRLPCPKFNYCPLHSHASEMAELLKEIKVSLEVLTTYEMDEKIAKLLSQIEGGKK